MAERATFLVAWVMIISVVGGLGFFGVGYLLHTMAPLPSSSPRTRYVMGWGLVYCLAAIVGVTAHWVITGK